VLIYSVVRVQPYVSLLDVLWQDVAAGHRAALTSELTVLEALAAPLKAGDTSLEALFRQALFASPDLGLAPVSRPVLERAAHLGGSAFRCLISLPSPVSCFLCCSA